MKSTTESLGACLLGILFGSIWGTDPTFRNTSTSLPPVQHSVDPPTQSGFQDARSQWPDPPIIMNKNDQKSALESLKASMNQELMNVEIIAWRLQAFDPEIILDFLRTNTQDIPNSRLQTAAGYLFLRQADRNRLMSLLRS